MKLFNCLLVSLLLACVSFTGLSAQDSRLSSESYFLHTIEKGQSLYSISSMYNVSQTDIIALNPGCENKVYIGQTLKIPQNKSNKQTLQYHTIQSQETLYQLTVKYKVSAKEICDANPGLSAQNFKIGQVIIIPAMEEISSQQTSAAVVSNTVRPEVKPNCKEIHKAKKKETIFSISRQYHISEKELLAANPELKSGLKKGDFLCIPYPPTINEETPEVAEAPKSNNELFDSSKKTYKQINPIKAAVILPFIADENNRGESSRMVEYYEGFLMAVDSLKRKGISIDLYTYDSGSTAGSMKALLAKKELKDMNIIFGPLNQAQIKPLADFAKKNKINLVIPFSSKDTEVFNNPSVYQINTPQSYLYSEAYEHFTRKFGDANVIILETGDSDKEKDEFIRGLKQELKHSQTAYKVLSASASHATLKSAMSPSKENIFVLTSGSNVALIRTLPQLTMLVRENPDYSIHLFGYPEWQTYTKDHLASFYELDTYFYSSFYTNNLFRQAVSFTSAYRKWYGKEMANTYPKYGMLGFDTGYFFLYGLSRYGSEFSDEINKVSITPIQTGFKFERANNWGGFINKKVFFVHFTKDFELVKLDFE